MNKLFFGSLFLLITFFTNAQVKVGIKAGLDFSGESLMGNGIKVTTSSVTGFNAGVIMNIGLGTVFIQPGLLFSQKGGSTYGGQESVQETLNYLEIPVNLVHWISNGYVMGFINTGPRLSIGISGQDVKSGSTISSQTQNVKFGSSTGDYNTLDFGWGIGGGIQVGNVFTCFNYTFGVTNLLAGTTDGIAVANHSASIAIGFMFGK